MARPSAVSVGLYYPTPTNLISPIADMIGVGPGESYSIVDPCAADGAAVIALAHCLFDKQERSSVSVYACEMEKTRHATLASKQWGCGVRLTHAHGDALRLAWETEEQYGDPRTGASLLFLNPPYDHDREHKRLEERFLRRFVACLAERGALVFLVPFYALSASADTIARELTNLRCFRFPDPDYEVFRQVVLVGVKRTPLTDPDPAIRAQVLSWSQSVSEMPILGSSSAPVVTMPGHASGKSGFSSWKVAPLDLTGLRARMKAWHSTDRQGKPVPISGVVPPRDFTLTRKYPVVMPLKPAHLAAAIAAGVFNGKKIAPDDPASNSPAVYVKGTFHRKFKTVDEKQNKEGEKTGEVQVQQPELVVTVLASGAYYTLQATGNQTGTNDPEKMTTGDLLMQYTRALMAVTTEQCPPLHDPSNPAHEIPLPRLARPLYRAQAHAVMALVKLIAPEFASLRNAWCQERNGEPENGILMGEIGSGKSSCADAVFEYMRVNHGYKKALIACPPHLIQSWADQVQAVTPWSTTQDFQEVDDVDSFAANDVSVGIMSRSAKLTHRWAGIVGNCGRCGATPPIGDDGIPMAPEELARKRMRCGMRKNSEGKWVAHGPRAARPVGRIARAVDVLALALAPVAPASPEVRQVVQGAFRRKILDRSAARLTEAKKMHLAAWPSARARIHAVLDLVAGSMLGASREGAVAIGSALLLLLAALDSDDVTGPMIERLYASTVFDLETYGTGASVRMWCRDALLVMRSRAETAERLKAMRLHVMTTTYGSSSDTWDSWESRSADIDRGAQDPETYRTGIQAGRTLHKYAIGSPECAVEALGKLAPMSKWRLARPCGEPLYQAVPEPRRVSLSGYLAKRQRGAFDFLVLDELQQLANGDSAQSSSEHRMTGLGKPTVGLTGSIMNGYAKSCFANQYALDPMFRDAFGRGALTEFCRTYGYIKQLVQHVDKDNKVVEWGSCSDRRETKKELGPAPGVHPAFVLQYLLRIAVTLHKTDLALDLPPCVELVENVEPSDRGLIEYQAAARILKEQIKRDRFDPLLAGQLFGQMSELPSMLDRATVDTGNTEDGAYEVAYPVNEKLEGASGKVLYRADGLPASVILPKEKRMLDVVQRELSEGRRVMLFAWHERVLPRLQRLVESELGEPCALLVASKVQAVKRQGWIDRNVIEKKRRVVVLNPAAVETGLNNLIWFSSQWWHENPGCSPITYRQAAGRVDRIGQTGGPQRETRLYIPVYEGTAQVLAKKLLMHKVGVSLATDGLNSESALAAAGIGGEEGTLDAFSVGRALFEMMERGEEQRAAPLALPATLKPANDAPRVAETPPARAGRPIQLDLFGRRVA